MRDIDNNEAVAAYLGVPVATVRAWRVAGIGPRGFRVGKHVRYRRSDVDGWIEAQASGPTAIGGNAA